jgi:hypothetical protein
MSKPAIAYAAARQRPDGSMDIDTETVRVSAGGARIAIGGYFHWDCEAGWKMAKKAGWQIVRVTIVLGDEK